MADLQSQMLFLPQRGIMDNERKREREKERDRGTKRKRKIKTKNFLKFHKPTFA